MTINSKKKIKERKPWVIKKISWLIMAGTGQKDRK